MTHPVYLVRHGQSAWNVQRLTQGQTPHPPLTDLGREQARAAADLIAADLSAAGLAADRILSSDLVRAVETAETIGHRLGLPFVTDKRLREQHLGSLEGRAYEETWAAAEDHDWSDPSLPIAGGESLLDVHERMAAVLTEIGAEQVSVIVSHGDAIRAAVAHLQGFAPHEAPWVTVPNGAVARIDSAITWLS